MAQRLQMTLSHYIFLVLPALVPPWSIQPVLQFLQSCIKQTPSVSRFFSSPKNVLYKKLIYNSFKHTLQQ